MKKYLSEHLVFFKDTFLTLVDPKGIFIGFGVIPSCFAVYFDKNEVSKIIISVFNFIPSLIHNFFERSLVLGIAEGVIGAFSVGLVLYSLIILFIFNGVLLVSDIIFMGIDLQRDFFANNI